MSGANWKKASVVMMIAILMSRVLGQLRDTVIAFRFGQNELTDAYRAAFQLPDLLFFMVAGGALSSALIPVFSEYFSTDRKQEAWSVFSSVATVMLCVVTLLVVLGELMAPWLTRLMFPGFDEERLALTVSLTRIVLPAQIFFLAGGLMMATLYSRQHFLTPALGPNIYNLGIIFGGLALALPFGIHGLAWGALIGAFAGNVLMPLWTMKRLGSQFSIRWDLKHPGARQVFKMMLPVMFGLSLPGIYMLILRVYGSLLPAGAISALDNANRQMQAPLGIVGQAIALGIFPTMAALAANAQWGELRRSLQQGLRLVWFLTLPATALLWVFSEDIGRVLLQYGKFKPSDTVMVSEALRMFSLGLFAWSGQALIARAFFSIKDSLTPVLIGSLTTVLFVPLCFLLMRQLNMSFAGLALATSIAATVQMVWMYVVLKRRLPPSKNEEPFVKPVTFCAIAALISGCLAGWLRGPFTNFAEAQQWQPNLISAFALIVLGGGSFVCYLLLARWMGIPEAHYVRTLVIRKRVQPNE